MTHGRGLLAVAFLLSGAGALIYEIVWTRLLSLVFGSTALAVTTIATVFMAGLALGALLAGSRADAVRRPARAYGLLELAIALYALAFPWLLAAFEPLWHRLVPSASLPLAAVSLSRFAAGFGLLLLPTACMGASLPLLARLFVPSAARVGPALGRLYGLNTLGAAAGCWLAGTRLLTDLGVPATTLVAAGLSLAAAALALLASRTAAPPAVDEAPLPLELPLPLVLGLAFTSGLTFMAYEILWVRLFRMYVPNPSLEVFALVLALCLAGLAAGSLLYAPVSRSLAGARGLAALQATAGLLGFLPYALLARPAGEHLDRPLAASAAVFVLTGVAYGLLFPLLNRLGAGSMKMLGRTVGLVFAALTAGNIAGSFLAGFVLLPGPGLKASLALCALLNLALAVAAALAAPGRRAVPAAALGLAGAALVSTAAWTLPPWPDLRLGPGERVIFYRDGLNSSTAVVEGPQVGVRAMMVESVHSRIRPDDVRTDIPLLLHPDPRRMLLVGFGSGANSRKALEVAPQLELTAVELDENLERTAPLFEAVNGGVLQRPDFTFVADDGRSYLHGVPAGRYDLIVMDAYLYYSHMDLYGREFTELALSRLAPGGIYCQRLPTFNLNAADFRSLLATFRSVFPSASLWKVGEGLYMLLGTTSDPGRLPRAGEPALAAPLEVDMDLLRTRLEALRSRPHPGLRLERAEDVLARLVAGPAEVEGMARGGLVISDLHPHRLLVGPHPREAGLFSPLFPAVPPVQEREISDLLQAFRADPARYVRRPAEAARSGRPGG